MTGHDLWSYRPYKPLIWNAGDIYICRVAPTENSIHLEWLDTQSCEIYCRPRGAGDFALAGKTEGTQFDIAPLEAEKDYEFYVQAGEKKSRVRLARTGKSVGTTVNYLHPEDEAYAFSGRFLCSPSLLPLPDGTLLASMDVFAHEHPQNLTLIFRSEDGGKTWHHLTELMPCFWGSLFLHRGEVYMLSVDTEYGSLLIGKSSDGGKTFGAPVCLLRGAGWKNHNGVHKSPQNVLSHNGRLYATLEWGPWVHPTLPTVHKAALVMSCDENADLLDPKNWHFTSPVSYLDFADADPRLAAAEPGTLHIEGAPVVDPSGQLLNIMRFHIDGHAIVYRVNEEDTDAPLAFERLMPFTANRSKFMIKYDAPSRTYWSVATRIYDAQKPGARNLLSLMASRDLKSWRVAADLLDYTNEDAGKIGFQYVDFSFDGEDLIFLCRTAMNGANTFHDTNYSTFHRIKDFRKL